MTVCRFSTPLMHRLALAYYRTQDRELLKRGVSFYGTPAKSYADIQNYYTHAAIHSLEGLGVPLALGRPGVAPHAWFASRKSAEAMGRRHAGYADQDLFDAIMAEFPVEAVMTPENVVTAGRLSAAALNPSRYTVFAKALTAVPRRPRPLSGGMGIGPASPSQAAEQRIYALVKVEDDILGAAVFQREPGRDLYRLALIGMRRRSDRLTDPRLHRQAPVAFKRFNEAIRLWPGVSFDFVGAAEPAAAAMGHSLFRYLRKLEMKRLEALSPAEYAVERRGVTTYRYPTFPREAIVTHGDTLRAMCTEGPQWLFRRLRANLRRTT